MKRASVLFLCEDNTIFRPWPRRRRSPSAPRVSIIICVGGKGALGCSRRLRDISHAAAGWMRVPVSDVSLYCLCVCVPMCTHPLITYMFG